MAAEEPPEPPLRRSQPGTPADAGTSFLSASRRFPRPRQAAGLASGPREERVGRRPPLGAPGGGPGRAGFSLGRPRRLGPALPPPRHSGRCARARPGAGRTWAPSRAVRPLLTAAPARTRAQIYPPAAAEGPVGPRPAAGRRLRPRRGFWLRCPALTSPAPRAPPRLPRPPRAAAPLVGLWGPCRRGPALRSRPSASPTAAAARMARRTQSTAAPRMAAAAGTGRRAGVPAGRAW